MKPITEAHYFGVYQDHAGVPPEHRANARILLERVNTLLERAERDGVTLDINPYTHTHVSGKGEGGWRLPQATTGAPNSAHKVGQAVDIYDPDGDLDDWCLDNQDSLVMLGLYLEHPAATKGWCHLGTRAPRSGKRVFYP